MADVQLEHGYTKIANKIVEKFAQINLSAYEWRVVWAILRKLYGWGKKEDWISVSQMEKLTGLDRRHISRTKKKLIKKNIISHKNESVVFNKDYDNWVSPKQVIVKGIASIGKGGFPKQVILLSPKQATTKDIPYKRNTTLQGDISKTPKKLTDPQQVWEAYKQVKGFTDNTSYTRWSKTLKDLTDPNPTEEVVKAVKEIGKYAILNWSDWNLGTVLKHYSEWKSNPGKYEIQEEQEHPAIRAGKLKEERDASRIIDKN